MVLRFVSIGIDFYKIAPMIKDKIMRISKGLSLNGGEDVL